MDINILMKHGDCIFIATRTERGNAGDFDFAVEAFAMREDAQRWMDTQISTLVVENGLDVNKDVDGWFVMINGWHHIIQYDVLEVTLR